ncbi:zinc finger protein 43-like [Onthophagus taurus]|uniref:zinc finger protein 43-like n=1 Tax=Onthophagus taurus TaxID=166361 RepID=UPI0039BE2F02
MNIEEVQIKEEIKDEPIFEEIVETIDFPIEIKDEPDSEDDIQETVLEEIKLEITSEPKYEAVEIPEEELVNYDLLNQGVYTIINNTNDDNVSVQQVTVVPKEPKKPLTKIEKNKLRSSSKKMVKCQICGNKFYSKHTLALHEKTHNISTIFNCDKCSEGFPSLGLLMEHQKVMKHFKATDSFQEKVRALNKRVFRCRACSLVFYSEKTFRFHVKIHAGLLKYSCDVCDDMFNTMSELAYHRETVGHGLKCQNCGIICATVQELEQHLKMHSKWKFFKCSDCNFATVVQKHLQQHRATNCPALEKTVSPIMCSSCGLLFQNKHIYKKHVCMLPEIKGEDADIDEGNAQVIIEDSSNIVTIEMEEDNEER